MWTPVTYKVKQILPKLNKLTLLPKVTIPRKITKVINFVSTELDLKSFEQPTESFRGHCAFKTNFILLLRPKWDMTYEGGEV